MKTVIHEGETWFSVELRAETQKEDVFLARLAMNGKASMKFTAKASRNGDVIEADFFIRKVKNDTSYIGRGRYRHVP